MCETVLECLAPRLALARSLSLTFQSSESASNGLTNYLSLLNAPLWPLADAAVARESKAVTKIVT